MEDFVANNGALILICHKGEVRPGWLREMDRRACALAQLLDKVRYLVWKGKCMWDFYDDIKKYEDCGILKKDTLYEALQAAANQTPEKVAVIDKDKALRFCDLMSEIDQYAEYFAGLGLKKGQRVVLQMPNKNLFVIVLFALVKIGVKPAMMLPAQRTIDVLAIGNMIEAVAYISVSDYMGYDYSEVIAPIENEIPTLKYILIEGMGKWKGDSDKWKDLTKLTEKSQPQELAGYRDTALYLLSGGTTGVPKIIPKMQQAYVYNAKAVAKRCEFDGSDVYMAVLPISHDLALANPGILGTLFTGGTVVLCESASFDEAFMMMEKNKVTMTTLVPAIMRIWSEVLEWYEADFSSMRQLFVGAAKVDETVLGILEEKLGVTIQQGYGLGEGITCATKLNDSKEVSYRTQGKPVSEGDEMRIVAPDGTILKNGEIGELVEKGPYTFKGYFKNDALNEKIFTEDGFFKTGDKAMVREDGNLVILGRVVEQINRAGENVIPSEIESILNRHSAISENCVFGMPDEQLGECTVACIVASEKLTRTDICQFMECQGVAAFKYPDRVFCVDHLVYKNVGKVDKRAMKEMVERGEFE